MPIIPKYPPRCNRCKQAYTKVDGHRRILDIVFHDLYNEYLCFDCLRMRGPELFGPSPAAGKSKESAIESKERNVLREGVVCSYSSRLKEKKDIDLSVDGLVSSTTCDSRRCLSEISFDAIKQTMSTPYGFYRKFPCVIPGTDKHSACFVIEANGREMYLCEVCSPARLLGLAEVYASIKYDRLKQMSLVERPRWFERLSYDAGLTKPVSVSISLPECLPDYVYTYADGVRLFVGLRDRRWDGEPFVLGRPFWTAYTGLSDRKVRYAIDALSNAGMLKAVVKPPKGSRKPIKWVLPGAVVHSEAPWAFSK